jgi:MATE family multidrug resistance protein
MSLSASWPAETRKLLVLAGPLIVNNLSIAGMQAADAMMAGRLGAEALAAVAVGGSVWFFLFTIVLGVMLAISPIVSRHYGAGHPELIGRYTRQGVYLAIVFSIPLVLAVRAYAGPALAALGIDPGFRELTVEYVRIIVLGAPAIFVFLAFRFTTEGIGRTRPIMFTSLFAFAANVFLNWVFMFGNLGAPAMGAAGAAVASAVTMWLMMLALVGVFVFDPVYRPLRIFDRLAPPRPDVLLEVIRLGLPISVTITAETGLFSATSVLMGTRGADVSAAHQVALNFASTTFMVPLALASAITVRVGHQLGRRDPVEARSAGIIGIANCALFMAFSATFMLVFRDFVVGLYIDDPAVARIALSLLLMAAIFQVADGVQIGAAAALRGYKDTTWAMLINTFSYWVLAFPLAYLAAVTYMLDPKYIWGGFVVGLSVAAVLLSLRFLLVARRAVADPVVVGGLPPGRAAGS